jgi:hypothetical protein
MVLEVDWIVFADSFKLLRTAARDELAAWRAALCGLAHPEPRNF